MSRKSAIIVGVAAVYVALRIAGIAESCLWFDEIFGVHAAEHPWGEMFGFIAQDLIHPPLFYVVLKLWMAIGGDGVWWLRLLPVVFSVLAMFPFLQICRELKLRYFAVVVAFTLFAVNGALIKYAQEVRMYSMLLFLSLMSVWLFTRYFVKGKSFVVLVIVNLLMVHTHYYGWLVVGAEIAAIAAFQRIKLRETLLMAGITAAGFLPWAWAVVSAARGGADVGQNIGWIERPAVGAVAGLLLDVVEPFYFQLNSAEPASIFVISVPLLLLIGYAAIRYLQGSPNIDEKRNAYLLGILTCVPVFAALLLSWTLPHSVWGSRHLIVVFAPFLILSAVFLTELKNTIERTLVLTLIGTGILVSLVPFAFTPTQEQPWCKWEKAAQIILSSEDGPIKQGEPVAVYGFEDLSVYHLWFALRNNPNYRVYKVDGIDGLIEDKAYFLPRGFFNVEKVGLDGIDDERLCASFRGAETAEQRLHVSVLSERGYTEKRSEILSGPVEKVFLVEFFRQPGAITK
ncbi:MAG: glycosyltransferase family 39 protein [Blastocatellia bacterium]|nr:glycosyltransferase family 39 protein [Blastocatellia bacterium]